MSLSYLATKSDFNLSEISQNLVAVFTVDPASDFASKLQTGLDQKKVELESKNIKVIFVSSKEGVGSSPDFILDVNHEILNQAKEVKNKSAESLVLFSIDGGNLKYLAHKESPEHQYDWMVVVSDFATNYANSSPNDQSLYKWGQIVPEDGDYLCVDCGYIASFQAGEVFPVCEVCLSGEPAGPTSSDGAYWEKV